MILDDVIVMVEVFGLGDDGWYMVVLIFGNVYGVYKLGNVVLKLELFGVIQKGFVEKFGIGVKLFDLVFYGGLGLFDVEIVEVVSNGVVKMNIDIDM